MRSIEGLFKEFLCLSYIIDLSIINKQVGDLYIDDFVILRKTKISWDFIKLTTGELISIPYLVIDLFKSLDVYHKGQIFNMKAKNNLEIFIQFMLAFVHNIESGKLSDILYSLKILQELGIKDLIGYIEDLLKINTSISGIMCIKKNTLTIYL